MRTEDRTEKSGLDEEIWTCRPRETFPRPLKVHGWLGLAIMVVGEALLFWGQPFVRSFFTPIMWTGYILFIDGLIQRSKGTSLMTSRPLEFLSLLPLSIGLWLIFEFYNLYLENWYYVGIPEEFSLRYFGYVWAFATIWPAILETAEALVTWKGISRWRIRPWKVRNSHLILSFVFGLFCLVMPFVVSSEVAHYWAGPVWVGFIFLLDPLNYRRRRYSLLRDLEKGDPRIFLGLLVSGMICGILWEFWNYWAGAKWHYTVPILGNVKIFEMPVLGYLGFPPFAVECYVMYYFLKNLFPSWSRA